ncbi:MAG: hypothetical protein IPM68_13540, partial [Flavobacteriales bacterium]|nr:hypothetical protein [Flavobacteriales bacterium]
MRWWCAPLLASATLASVAQSDWQATGMPFSTTRITRFHHDTVQDVLYIAGRAQELPDPGWNSNVLV